MQPREVLFSVGDDSQAGIFIVVEGALGVYLEENGALCHTNTLCTGESVGDLDVLDGAPVLDPAHAVECAAGTPVLEPAQAGACHHSRCVHVPWALSHHGCSATLAATIFPIRQFVWSGVCRLLPKSLPREAGVAERLDMRMRAACPACPGGLMGLCACLFRRAAQRGVHRNGRGRDARQRVAGPLHELCRQQAAHAADIPAQGACISFVSEGPRRDCANPLL